MRNLQPSTLKVAAPAHLRHYLRELGTRLPDVSSSKHTVVIFTPADGVLLDGQRTLGEVHIGVIVVNVICGLSPASTLYVNVLPRWSPSVRLRLNEAWTALTSVSEGALQMP